MFLQYKIMLKLLNISLILSLYFPIMVIVAVTSQAIMLLVKNIKELINNNKNW